MDVQAVLLAAGASTRMGHPKALTPVGGMPALARMALACEQAGVGRPLVVLGEAHDEVKAALERSPHAGRFAWIRNPDPASGRTGSLQRGLVAASAPRILVWPVDHPLVKPETLRRLLGVPGEWVVPLFQGRGGHPILLGPMAIAALLAAPCATPLREVPRAVGLEVVRVEVDDPAIHWNLDTPGDLARLHGEGI